MRFILHTPSEFSSRSSCFDLLDVVVHFSLTNSSEFSRISNCFNMSDVLVYCSLVWSVGLFLLDLLIYLMFVYLSM